jgi:hypothetical protein
VIPIVEALIAEYRLDPDQALLVGEGGGAAALIPYIADVTKLRYAISRDAEVISSIGVALALVRETVERVVPNARPEDLAAVRREALDAAVRLGAAPEAVEVTVEIDAVTHRVRATAMGAAEMAARATRAEVDEATAREAAAQSMGAPPGAVRLAAATSRMRVFQGAVEERKWGLFKRRRHPIRAVDAEGVIRVQRGDGLVRQATRGESSAALRQIWEATTIYNGDSIITPDMFVIAGGHALDLCGVNTLEQAQAIAESEFDGLAVDAPIALIAVPGVRGIG